MSTYATVLRLAPARRQAHKARIRQELRKRVMPGDFCPVEYLPTDNPYVLANRRFLGHRS